MAIKIRNPYYFIAGILAILFAVTHAGNGQSVVLPKLDIEAVSVDTQIAFTYVWHIITAENLIFGFAFLIMSIVREPSKVSFTAWIILSILIVRLLVILGVTIILDASALGGTLIDSIAIIIYIGLLILGIKLRNCPVSGRPSQSGRGL
ncbi:MAG: hypothetical protein K0Q90_4244 [Paenibacillaceae bacterium]|nr:hypothetical protein [Paenibacillaceae bacterium]